MNVNQGLIISLLSRAPQSTSYNSGHVVTILTPCKHRLNSCAKQTEFRSCLLRAKVSTNSRISVLSLLRPQYMTYGLRQCTLQALYTVYRLCKNTKLTQIYRIDISCYLRSSLWFPLPFFICKGYLQSYLWFPKSFICNFISE